MRAIVATRFWRARGPVIAAVLPLGEVRKAHEWLDGGHGRGMRVLRVAP